MYISQPSQETEAEFATVKKKNKTSLVVFFVNLFLMAVAFFMIKNQDKERINGQKDNNIGDEGALAEEAAVAENTDLPTAEVDQTNGLNLIENNVGAGSTQPAVTKSGNTGVSKTVPQVNTASKNTGVSNTIPQASPKTKKSTKTKTS